MRASLLTMALLAMASPAWGQSRIQTDTGSRIGIPERARIPVSSKLTDEQAAQLTMNRFMACVVQRSRAKAERFVALPPGTPAAQKMVPALADSDCLADGELRFKPALMRGGIYEALYRADFGRAVPGPLSGRAEVAPIGGEQGAGGRGALLAFGDCVARADATGAHDVLMSTPAAKGEAEAIAKLMPALNACLSRGATVRFSRPVLRGVLAETTYRLAKAPVAAAAGAGSGTP